MVDEVFENERRAKIAAITADPELRAHTTAWLGRAQTLGYSYNFDWLGLPIIQYPQDVLAMQELIFAIKPALIIETGVARGGSAVFYASLLELNAICGGPKDARIVAIDIDIRPPNRAAIEAHPLSARIDLIQGSSTDAAVVAEVRSRAEGRSPVLVCLDSNHTHQHVLEELRAYAPLVSPGSYIIAFDTLIEDLPPEAIGERPWGVGDNPKTAVHAFLAEDDRFEIDVARHGKLQVTVARDGYLKRVR
jgi:cephalosporin hydroxylase